MSIYERSVRSLLTDGVIANDSKVLVACGGDTDALALNHCGLTNVLISNLDDGRSNGIGDYGWQRADAEKLPFADKAFDLGIIHQGLHHCQSPHLGLIELMRVARNVLVIEARDSFLMNLAVDLGFGVEYEIESVALYNDGKGDGGGLRNSAVPNFIYRWTEREVRKTVETAYPERVHELRFFYDLFLPDERISMASAPKRAAYRVAALGVKLAFKFLPKQGNRFAFAILDTGKDKPWITRKDGRPVYDMAYDPGFDASKYVREQVDYLK